MLEKSRVKLTVLRVLCMDLASMAMLIDKNKNILSCTRALVDRLGTLHCGF